MSLYFNEKHSPCWPRQSKPSLKLLDYGRKIQNDVHIDTYYRNQSSYHDDKSTLQCLTCVFCPQLIRNVRSRRRIYSSSIIGYPVNSDLHTWERLLKCYAKNSTHTYITLLIIDMDFLYQFNMGLIAPLFTVSFHEKFEKKMFFKIFKVGRSVIGWQSG